MQPKLKRSLSFIKLCSRPSMSVSIGPITSPCYRNFLLVCSFAHRLELGYEQDAKRGVIEFAAHNRSWHVGTLFSEEQFTGFQRRCTEAGPCRSTHLLRARFDENQAISVHLPKPTFPDEAVGRFKNSNVSIFTLLPCIISCSILRAHSSP
jgi:hypothetical protein